MERFIFCQNMQWIKEGSLGFLNGFIKENSSHGSLCYATIILKDTRIAYF